jgi:GR25 family glycosyltransferase involved in LPS biosynthesis
MTELIRDRLGLNCEWRPSLQAQDRSHACQEFSFSILDIPKLTGYDDALRYKKRAGCYSSGVYAYIIKPQGAKKLIDWINEKGFLATDNQVNTNVMDVKVCIPPVARLHPVMKSREIIGQMSTSRQSPNPHTGTGMENAEQK